MFSAGGRPIKTGPTPSDEMGYNLSVKRSSTLHKNSKTVKETTLQSRAIERPTCREMLNAKKCISKPCGDLPPEPRGHEHGGNVVQQKTSENYPKTSMMEKATKHDELVRYMSNVPGYLQRVENKEDMQGKALNVGVLDWGRLENYKCNQKGISVGIGTNATLPCSNLSTKMTTGSSVLRCPTSIETPYGNKQHLSSSSGNNSYGNGDIFRHTKLCSQDAGSFHDEHKIAARSYRSSVMNSLDATLANSKRRDLDHKITSKVEHQSSKTKYKRAPVRPKESLSSYDRKANRTVDNLQGLDREKTARKQISAPKVGTSAFDPSDSSSGSKKEKRNVDNCGTKNQIKLQETEGDPPPQHHADKSRNIVLLLPRSYNSFPKQPRKSQDENVPDGKRNFFSDAFSDKEVFFSEELRDEIPRSCPLPSRAYTSTEKKMAPHSMNIVDDQTASNVINITISESLDETSKTFNQETAATRKGRHPSPNHRFSFSSLSRMTRSFSFKENSVLPQLTSTYVSVKSGPVTSTSSAGMDNSNREKECGHIRARSSPLRRILDPLLPKFKSKTSAFSNETDQQSQVPKFKGKTSSFSDETDQQSWGSCDSSFKTIKVAESLDNEKPEATSVKAQLVLTTSNGLPLYRFVTNSSIIIATPLMNVIAPGKNDPQCNYVLYAIDEIKKRNGSWINQASKEKTCFVYNVVGEMKLNSSSSLDLSGENLNNQDLVKEFVLFGAEPRQTGQALPRGMPNSELAAVIMKKASGILGYDMQHSHKQENVKGNGFSWRLTENVQNNSFTVILPGGIHSVPKTGVPSSLIHRWRTGGSCDCGGWDIGCQLCVLANENQEPKSPRTFSFLKSDCIELFVQGETQQRKPIFSMAQYEKGKYSLEFSTSISLLQAFFIGVSAIIGQRSFDQTEDSYMSEEKAFCGSSNEINGLKAVQKETPMKYTPTPPLSPAGRV